MRKMKKAIAGLLCMAMLMFWAVPAAAENTSEDEANGCSHSTLAEIKSGIPAYKSIDSSEHTKTYKCDLVCASCGERYTKSVTVSGSHSYSYVDLGHTGAHSHKYQIICSACGYNEVVFIACSNFRGLHVAP